nr:plastocyanin/azurin family copper-binding protein [Maricaulis maris]
MTFDEEGLYGIKCAPHYAAGMIVLIEVGDGEATVRREMTRSPAARASGRFGLL